MKTSASIIKQLFDITNDNHSSLHEKIHQVLLIGINRFKLDIAIFAHINQKTNSYKVENCIAPKDIPIHIGDIFQLNNTYCSITYASESPIAIEHVNKNDQFKHHPAYQAFKLESYLGIPIKIANQKYGTLNFSSHNPYPRNFIDTDIDVLRLMAMWIENQLINKSTII